MKLISIDKCTDIGFSDLVSHHLLQPNGGV